MFTRGIRRPLKVSLCVKDVVPSLKCCNSKRCRPIEDAGDDQMAEPLENRFFPQLRDDRLERHTCSAGRRDPYGKSRSSLQIARDRSNERVPSRIGVEVGETGPDPSRRRADRRLRLDRRAHSESVPRAATGLRAFFFIPAIIRGPGGPRGLDQIAAKTAAWSV